MRSWTVRIAFALVAHAALSGIALAQAGWTPASEIIGQPVQVTTNGVTNVITLNSGGQVAIASPAGRVVNGTWTAANGQMCLSTGTAHECWAYNAPFQAGQPVTVTSSCNATSTWLAAATNGPPTPPAQRGERGR